MKFRPAEEPESMTEEDQYMVGSEGYQAAPCERFKDYVEDRGEERFGVVKHKRHEECTGAPGPDNDMNISAVKK
jgi:hypothetical protein